MSRARGDGSPARRIDLAGVAEALGHGEHGGQRQLNLLGPVVVLELELPDRAPVVQATDPAGEGEIEQLGQLGTDLPGLPVDGVAPEEDEIEGAGAAQHRGEGPRRGQGVGAGEGRVAGVQPGVSPPGHRLAQDVLGGLRSERHHGAGATAVPGERHALGHGPAAVGVHLDADPGAHEPATVQAEGLGQRDLLRQGRDRQAIAGGPAHAITLSPVRAPHAGPVTGPARRRQGSGGPRPPPSAGSPCPCCHARSG